MDEAEALGVGRGGDLLQPSVLQRRVVVGGEVVQPDHGLTPAKQRLADVEADEAGGAGDYR